MNRWKQFIFQNAVLLTFLLGTTFIICRWIFQAHTVFGNARESWGNDHLHHARAAYAVLFRGLEIYTRPFGDVAGAVPYPPDLADVPAPKVPLLYPPGMFAVFLIPGLIGRYLHLDQSTFGSVIVVCLFVYSTIALYLAARILRPLTGINLVLFALTWMLLVYSTAVGFYDGAWLIPACLAILSLRAQRPEMTLLFASVALLINYRAVVVFPVAISAAVDFWRGRRARSRSAWAVVVVSLCLAAVSVGAFAVCYRAMQQSPDMLAGFAKLELPIKEFRKPDQRWIMVVTGLAMVATAVWARRGVGAGCFALVTAMTIFHAGKYWHGLMLPIAPLACALPGGLLPRVQTLLGLSALWLLAWWSLFYGFGPGDFFDLLLQVLRSQPIP